MKQLFSIILTMVLLSFSLQAQDKNVTNEKLVIPNPDNKITVSENQNYLQRGGGDVFVLTGYDYMANSQHPRMIDLVDIDGDDVLDPVFTAMERITPAGNRFVMFGYKAFGVVDAFNAFDPTTGTSGSVTYGWGTLQYCEGGPLDGKVFIMAHSNGAGYSSVIDLENLEPVTPFSTGTMPANFPGFVYQPDGNLFGTITDYSIHNSTDQGGSWTAISAIGAGDPNVSFTAGSGPSEPYIKMSDDGQYIAFTGTFQGGGVTGNPDIVYWYGSMDAGASWNGIVIGVGSGTNPEYGQVANRDYAPYFDNFGQVSTNVDNLGYTHVMINGYGEGLLPGATDTTNVFPMLYWNSNNAEWLALTVPGQEAPGDAAGNLITGGTTVRTYPGNGIGNAYGTVSVSDDGQFVFAAWQGMEFLGEIGNSNWNMYPGDGGPETGVIYYTDIYYTYSTDGGSSWSSVDRLEGEASVMETYPNLAGRPAVDPTSGNYVVHYLYYEDAVPGAAIFNGQVAGQNSWSADGAWKYNSMEMDFGPTSVDGNPAIVDNFSLDQNYPNPFNPSTTIKYSVAERSNVSIKIYDMLGKEIATLVNNVKEAGSYEVNFDASNLASGMYVYSITAGNFTASKKMMLLK